MRQHITISLDADTLALAKQLAAQRHLSISGLLAANLEQQLARIPDYEQAKRQALAGLKQAQFDLGGNYLSRDDSHAR